MKTIILSLFLIVSSAAKCQISSNIISKEEFNSIKINNVKLEDIKATNGKKTQLDNLFSYNIQKSNIDSEGEFYNYEFDGFSIGFSGIIGRPENPIISGFEITNNNWTLTIKGKDITLGSYKDVLGSVIYNNQDNGENSIVYQYCDGCSNFLSLYLDSNNRVTKIIYIEMT